MIRSLQKRFILSSMLVVTILLTVLLGAINISNLAVSNQQNHQMLDILLKEESNPQRPPKNEEPKEFFGGGMNENSRKAAVYFTVRADEAGNIIESKVDRIANVSNAQAAELCRLLMEKELREGKIEHYLFRSAKNERDGTTLYLFLDTNLSMRDNLRILFFSFTAGIICWLLMLLLVRFLSKRAIQPIAENIARQKQFVTDAGHEIKTPLAIILANTEAMELYEGENKWSRNIREQTERLNGLMQNLLALSKADEDNLAFPKEILSPDKLVLEIMESFSESMALKELRLSKEVEAGLQIRANSEQIRRLFSILLDNAVKYSPKNGEITVLLTHRGKKIAFEIENQCEKLPSCPPEKLFDRFYRDDAARTQKNGGYGIGLSAAKSIVELYKGNIQAEYFPPDKIKFSILF